MGRNNYFQFKQFRIIQEKSAMKVGVDGVLLGAWADIFNVNTILDVGTGTGLIALMLAQRSDAWINALEIDENSWEEACSNVSLTKWGERIIVKHISFQKFSNTSTQKFDLIISNPPFFENSQKAIEPKRSNARHNDLLPFNDLIKGSMKLMNENSRIVLILPYTEAERFIQLARSNGLFPSKITKVKPAIHKPFHRYLMEFSLQENPINTDELSIEKEKHFDYTPEYINLTKEFYLKF